jgi:RNA-directed DNA polymerase
LAIRRVTQINKGRRTPGVDREIITRPEERIALFYWLEGIRLNNWQPPPTRRVEIPKGGGKTRALGIPTIRDRVIQAIVKNALEPEWEAVFEATSYGFRPGRSAHDAIVSIWSSYSGWGTKHKEWILDADIKGAFDHISHDYLLAKLGHFPAKPLINKWLKAGVMVGLDLSPTITGTPQGGIISPVLANIALHGMEDALGIVRTASGVQRGAHKVVRYADDFVVLCQSRTAAEAAWAKLQAWLAQAGLEMSEEKTKIINIWDGVDFLGFTIRMSKTGSKARGFSVYTKPSRKSMEKFKTKVRDIFNRGRHKQPDLLLKELNPLIVGWALYFRMGSSAKAFSTLDSFLWH